MKTMQREPGTQQAPTAVTRRSWLRRAVGATAVALGAVDGLLYYRRSWQPTKHTASQRSQAAGHQTHPPVPQAGPVGVYDVRSYGATGDGSHNDGPALRAALDHAIQDMAANPALAALGATLYLPAGKYLTDVAPNPQDHTLLAALHVPGGFRVQGDGMGATILQFLPGLPQGAAMIMNSHPVKDGDEGIAVEDLTLDGSADQQHGIVSHYGLNVWRTRGLRCTNVRARDFYGSSQSGTGESFQIGGILCSEGSFTHCEAVGTSPQTASGFGLASCWSMTYIDCLASGMGITAGFTHNSCRDIRHFGCVSQQNAVHGFNSEVSTDVVYVACRAGGQSVATAVNPYAASTSLGNKFAGFVCNASARLTYIGCEGSYNSNSGLYIVDGNPGAGVQVQGGVWRNNGAPGIRAGSIGGLSISGNPIFEDNAGGDVTNAASARGGSLNAPPLPASGAAVANPFPFPCLVAIQAAVPVSVAINGITVISGASVAVPLPVNGSIVVGYQAGSPPSWSWLSLL